MKSQTQTSTSWRITKDVERDRVRQGRTNSQEFVTYQGQDELLAQALIVVLPEIKYEYLLMYPFH